MRIAILAENPFYMGGAERAVIALANMLSGEHDVFLLYKAKGRTPEESYCPVSPKVNVVYAKELANLGKGNLVKKAFRYINKKFFGCSNLKFLESCYLTKHELLTFAEYINKNHFDVVITSQLKNSIYLGAIKNRVNCKCIGWQHSSFDAYFNTKHNYYWNQHALAKKYISRLDACVVLTDRDALAYRDMGIRACRIYNSVSTSECFDADQPSCPVILWIGRLQEYTKGLDYLFEIAQKVLSVKQCEFWIVGDGPDKQKLQNQCNSANLETYVKFFGATTEVEKFYAASDVVISTSRWEGFGLTLIEAMAQGTPVITFSNSGPQEIVGNSGAGILISKYNIDEFADEIIALINDKDKHADMSNRAAQRAKDFAEENIKAEWIKLIRQQ